MHAVIRGGWATCAHLSFEDVDFRREIDGSKTDRPSLWSVSNWCTSSTGHAPSQIKLMEADQTNRKLRSQEAGRQKWRGSQVVSRQLGVSCHRLPFPKQALNRIPSLQLGSLGVLCWLFYSRLCFFIFSFSHQYIWCLIKFQLLFLLPCFNHRDRRHTQPLVTFGIE